MPVINQSVNINVNTNSASIAYMLVDLSDTEVWKHKHTGAIVLKSLCIAIDPDAGPWLGAIKIGFLSAVDATNGNFNELVNYSMLASSALHIGNTLIPKEGILCAERNHLGTIIANSTLFQDDVNLGGPGDSDTITYPSGVGDLVMIVDGDGTNFVHVALSLTYDTIQ